MNGESPCSLRIRRLLILHAIRFFRLRGSNEKAARGFAVGMACNFIPTFGLGAFISGFLAHLCGGNMVAGFIGGSMLAFFWPLVFYFNIRTGSHFTVPPVPVEDYDDVTPQTISALVLGKTFAVGAVINGLIISIASYFLFLLAYERVRPRALAALRNAARAMRLETQACGRNRKKVT